MTIRTYAAGALAAALAVGVAIGGGSSASAAAAATIDGCTTGTGGAGIVYLVPVGVTVDVTTGHCTFVDRYPVGDVTTVNGAGTLSVTLGNVNSVEDLVMDSYDVVIYPCDRGTDNDSRPLDWQFSGGAAAYWDPIFASAVSLCSLVSGGSEARTSFVLTYQAQDGSCTSSSTSGTDSSWVQLLRADQCVRAGKVLLGWATSPDFPVAVAKAQADKGRGAIDDSWNGMRMIFIPAGGYAAVSGDNTLYSIWSA